MNTELETRAQALIVAGAAATLDEAIPIVASECPDLYNDYLASLSSQRPVTTANVASKTSESLFEVSARALVTAGDATTFDQACEILARDSPKSYEQYLSGLK